MDSNGPWTIPEIVMAILAFFMVLFVMSSTCNYSGR